LYESGVVLAIAVEASASKRCGVCTPTSHREFAQAIAADVDAAVDYGNEMSTGDEVKDMPSPGRSTQANKMSQSSAARNPSPS
jgi:hypothetical protein